MHELWWLHKVPFLHHIRSHSPSFIIFSLFCFKIVFSVFFFLCSCVVHSLWRQIQFLHLKLYDCVCLRLWYFHAVAFSICFFCSLQRGYILYMCTSTRIWCSSKSNWNSNRHKFRLIWHATTWSFRSKSLQSTIVSVEKLIYAI